jgi:uncharacterized protein
MPTQPVTPDFQDYQRAFTRHVRDPEKHPRPEGVPAGRMEVYNELLFKNIVSQVSSCFPVARSILGEHAWKALVRAFFATHRCRTPYFRQIPEEFLQYMQERESSDQKPDFLIYLLHYEWVELSVEISDKEADMAGVDPAGDLCVGNPVLAPARMLLTYPYAVHRIGKDYQPSPEQREQTSLLVFRNSSDKVRFIVMNQVSARLIALLDSGSVSGNQALAQIVEELRHPNPESALEGGCNILENLREEGAIIGTLRNTGQPA